MELGEEMEVDGAVIEEFLGVVVSGECRLGVFAEHSDACFREAGFTLGVGTFDAQDIAPFFGDFE